MYVYLFWLCFEPFFLLIFRRLKNDVLDQLPTKRRQTVCVYVLYWCVCVCVCVRACVHKRSLLICISLHIHTLCLHLCVCVCVCVCVLGCAGSVADKDAVSRGPGAAAGVGEGWHVQGHEQTQRSAPSL